MNDNKPISYESSKVIILFLETNLRFQIANRCSSLHNIERIVPLHIDQLCFSDKPSMPKTTSVNSTKFLLGTYRNYPPNAIVPFFHTYSNNNDGAPIDLDQFGDEDYSSNRTILHGDVIIGRILTGLGVNYDPTTIYLYKAHLQQMSEINRELNESEKLSVEYVKDSLQSKYNKRDNIRVPFTTLAQLSIKNPDGSKKTLHFNGKIYEAEKCLYNILFGNRKSSIIVRKLHLDTIASILRLPFGMKLKVKELKMSSQLCDKSEGIRKLLDASSFPLNVLELRGMYVKDLEEEIEKTAKKLIFGSANYQVMQSLNNFQIHVGDMFSSSENYLQLIQRWKTTNPPIGTCHSYGVVEEETIIEIMSNEQLNGIRLGDRLMEVPINDASKLLLSLFPNPKLVYTLGNHQVEWVFKMEIVAV